MAINELVYTTKRHLESATRRSFRHSHIYELIAASFGFNTRASLDAAHIMVVMEAPQQPAASSLATLQRRLAELGYEAVADLAGAALLGMTADRFLGIVSIESVIWALQQGHRGDPDDWHDFDEHEVSDSEQTGNSSPSLLPTKIALLIDGLNGAASRDNAAAHYALALVHRSDDLSEEEGSSFWYSLMEQGRDLEGAQLEWATAYKKKLLNAERKAFHLKEAARLGWAEARLDLALENAQRAEHQGDLGQAEHWYKEAAGLGHVEAMRSLIWLAEESSDADAISYWNQQAAMHGDVDAMRDLIDEDDQSNLFQNWIWVYLAEHLGTDLCKSTLRAYHEGGLYADQEYDDDLGGPLYVAGDEAVQLEALSALDDTRAKEAAKELFNRISRS